jgi:hypothetical protein
MHRNISESEIAVNNSHIQKQFANAENPLVADCLTVSQQVQSARLLNKVDV